MTSSGVDQHIDIGQWELSFWTSFVKVPEVDATSYMSVLLLHGDDICKPSWVLDGLDEVNIEEFLNLLLDLDFQFWAEVSRRLLNRLGPFLDIEFVGD